MNNEVITEIKKELRANMNGVASAAMRQTDDYRVNFGIELPRIQQIASEFPSERQLAQTLWHESVRECKILATILMPTTDFDEELCDIWVSEIRTVEMAQIFALNLMRRLPYVSSKAFEWISADNTMLQITGYFTMCHVLRKGEMSERSEEELFDQLACDLNASDNSLSKAAVKTLQIFASLSDDNMNKAKKMADYLF